MSEQRATLEQLAADAQRPSLQPGALGTGSLSSTVPPSTLADTLGQVPHQAAAHQLGTQAFAQKITGDWLSATPSLPNRNPTRVARSDWTNFPPASADITSALDQPKLAQVTPDATLRSQNQTTTDLSGLQDASSPLRYGQQTSITSAGVGAGAVSVAGARSSATPASPTTTSSASDSNTLSSTGQSHQASSAGSSTAKTAPKQSDPVTNLISAVAGVALSAPGAAAEAISGHASKAAASLHQTTQQQGLKGVVQNVSAAVSGTAASAQSYVTSAGQSVSGAAQTSQSKYSDPNAPSITQHASNVGSSLSSTASSYASSASHTVSGLATQASTAIHTLGEKVGIVSPAVQEHPTAVTALDHKEPILSSAERSTLDEVDRVPRGVTGNPQFQKEAPVLSAHQVRPDVSYAPL